VRSQHLAIGVVQLPPLDDIGLSEYGSNGRDPILFTCTAVASFQPTRREYADLPFLSLEVGDIVNITKDAGRPSQHPGVEPVVSDGVDTLFIGTKLPDSSQGSPEVGWLWASFIMPFET
jgi:dynamin-binding protein